jgi:glyoxylase-like metal-dependent hydrolase (beta-lactamase superfamily II)
MRVAERWFDVRQVDDGVLRITEPHVHPLLRSNLYLVPGGERDVMVDAGCGIANLRTELTGLVERPVVAVATHRHGDHVGGMPEFEEIVAHRLDARSMELADGFTSLVLADYEPSFVESVAAGGYELTELLIDALPSEDYDPAAYRVPSVTPTRIVDEGDVVTTGDRRFEVLHLPGHTPGEIGLWEAQTGTLFSGDCVYESGDLLDQLPESNVPDYVKSMRRLRDLPVRVVHGGHDESFGRPRLLELIDGYLARRG